MSDLICGGCRRMLNLSICPLQKEEQVAASLEDYVVQYCEAVVERRMSLAAADRFYRDLMVYQWRLNALEVLIRSILSAVLGTTDFLDADGAPTAGADVTPILGTDVTSVLDTCLTELEEQHAEAIASFEERASHYALGVATKSTGQIKRFAASEAERQLAIDHYRELAKDTFSEVMDEARLMVQLGVNKKVLCQFKTALEGRVAFWTTQLEETWVAWHDVTARMHRTGDEAMAAWRRVVTNLEVVQECLQETTSKTSLQQALALFAARGLEVELVNSLGLTGLSDDMGGETDRFVPDTFSQEARVRSLISVFELLHQAGFLHEVGQALAEALRDPRDQTGVAEMLDKCGGTTMPTPHAQAAVRQANNYGRDARTLRASNSQPVLQTLACALSREGSQDSLSRHHVAPSALVPAPATPRASSALDLAAAALLTPTSVVRRANEELEEEGVSSLIPWLTESLVQATRKAVEHGEGEQLIKLLKLCRSLGNEGLATAVYKAATQHSDKLVNSQGEGTKEELLKLLTTVAEDPNEQDEVLVVLPDLPRFLDLPSTQVSGSSTSLTNIEL